MPEPLHLFDLPVDILSLILSNLLTAPNNTPIPLCPCTTKSTINPLPIFLIHPSLYAIAHPLFYGPSNTFLLDLTGNHASHVRHFIDDNAADDFQPDDDNNTSVIAHKQLPLPPVHRHTAAAARSSRFLLLSQEPRRKVRKLEMRIDRLRGWLWDDLGPFLQDMAVRGSLADMTLLVDERSSSTKNSSKDSSRAQSSSRAFLRDKRRVFERPPLEGLVRLLADPGIRQARLRVRGRHQRAWCEFHAGSGRECGSLSLFRQTRVGGGEGGGEGGGLAKEEDEEVVDVDWRAILSRVDPEGRRRAVAWQV